MEMASRAQPLDSLWWKYHPAHLWTKIMPCLGHDGIHGIGLTPMSSKKAG